MTAQDLQRELRREALPWQVFENRDGLRAERLGSVHREAFHAKADVLLDLVREQEARLNPQAVEVGTGLLGL